jgi:hypothetical protein
MRARALLRLYPPAWRARYQEEVEALLDQHAVTLATMFDLLWGALDARLDPAFASERMFRPMSRMRLHLVAVFCAFAFFILGAMGFARLTDPRAPFDAAGQASPAIGAAFRLTVLIPQIGLGVLLLGGLPVAWDILWHAWRERNWRTLAFFATPPVLLALCAAYIYRANTSWLTFNSQGNVVGTPGDLAVLIIAGILLFGSGVASVVVVSYAVARSQISWGALRFARWAALALTLAIALDIAAVIAWGALTYSSARWLYDGPCGVGCPGVADTNQISVASLGLVVAWMSVALVVAAIYTIRSFTIGGPEPDAGVALVTQVA